MSSRPHSWISFHRVCCGTWFHNVKNLSKILILLAIPSIAAVPGRTTAACSAVTSLVNSHRDASTALVDCIDNTPVGGRVELKPGTYTLRKQMRIVKAVTLVTAGLPDGAAPCDRLGVGHCATIEIALDGTPNPNIMPIEIAANGVTMVHLVIQGTDNSKLRSDCSLPEQRPLGGGMRVLGSRFTLRKSLLHNVTCYTAMEVLARANALTIEDNLIGPNGDHLPGGIWADGITIHDSQNSIVRGNRFIDNTDVQLILGGCRHCRIDDNIFRHSGAFARASFAELMLQAFPNTTGDYTGTVVTANDINCGTRHLCGFGIMIGANPWKSGEDPHYPGPMFGGTISGNRVSNAKIGINVDSPTGPVALRDNSVSTSGGRFHSDCGLREWPEVNVAPGAQRFIVGNVSNKRPGQVSTMRCIINRRPE